MQAAKIPQDRYAGGELTSGKPPSIADYAESNTSSNDKIVAMSDTPPPAYTLDFLLWVSPHAQCGTGLDRETRSLLGWCQHMLNLISTTLCALQKRALHQLLVQHLKC